MIPAETKINNSKKHIVTRIDSFFMSIEKLMFFVSIVALLVIFLSMIFGVISREIINKSMLWTNDLAGYAMIYLIFLSAPLLLREKGHVMVDIVTNGLSRKLLKINSIIICIVSIIVTSILFLFSLQITIDYYLKGIVMLNNIPWPKFALTLPIVIGCFMLLIRFFIEILRTIFLDETIFSENKPEI